MAFLTWRLAKDITFENTVEDGPQFLDINEEHFKKLLEKKTKQLCEEIAEQGVVW